MKMSAFKGLKLLSEIPAKSGSDPVAKRRIKLVERLKEQAMLANDPTYVRKETKFRGKGEERHSVTQEKRVRPWWRATPDGNVVFSVYASGRAVELAKGMFGISTTTDELPNVIEKAITGVTTGELDSALTAAANSKPKKQVKPTKKAA
jgi:uncharacterized protein DUF6641